MDVTPPPQLGSTFRTWLSSAPPHKEFVGGERKLSYGELSDRVNQTLNLFNNNKFRVGDRIIVACADDIEMAVIYIAAVQYGLCTAVIDPHSSVSEAILLINTISPNAIFFDKQLCEAASKAAPLKGALLFPISNGQGRETEPTVKKRNFLTLSKKTTPATVRSFQDMRAEMPVLYENNNEVPEHLTALVLFTSGTTSKPKGVELSFRNLRTQFETFVRQYNFEESSVILNHLPLHHTDGLNLGVAITLFCGGTWIRQSGAITRSLGDFIAAVKSEKVTHIITVPTVIALLDQLPPTYDDCFNTDDLQFIGSTAGFLDTSLWRRFEARFQITIVNSYGLTETVSEALYCGPDTTTRRVGSIGRPVDCDAKVIDEYGATLAPGITGELIVRGSNIMKGYWDDPVSTAAVLREGWLYTGDLAQTDDEGFFYIVGRKKNMLIRAGANFYPEDLTNSVMELPEVLEASTVGIADNILGEKVVLCIVPASNSESTVLNQVRRHCHETLAPERRPDEVIVMDSLPRGPSGKVILNDLIAYVENHLLGDEQSQPLSGNVEGQLISIASSILGLPDSDISLDSSSEDLHQWDSLAHLALISAIEKHFSLELNAEEIIGISNLRSASILITGRLAND